MFLSHFPTHCVNIHSLGWKKCEPLDELTSLFYAEIQVNYILFPVPVAPTNI